VGGGINTGNGSVAIGSGSTASGQGALAAGGGKATSNFTFASGGGVASGQYSSALGSGSSAAGTASVALAGATANGANAFASGSGASTGYDNQIAIGQGTKTIGNGAGNTAIGYNSTASGNMAFAFGDNASAEGSPSYAFGRYAKASGSYSYAFGDYATAASSYDLAIGHNTYANYNSIAIGYYSKASGYGTEKSLSIGNYTNATAPGAIALGNYSSSEYDGDMAFGKYTRAYAPGTGNATVMGLGYDNNNKFVNNVGNSFAIGYMNAAGDTTPEFFVRHGQVGINTAAPSTALDVVGNITIEGSGNGITFPDGTVMTTSTTIGALSGSFVLKAGDKMTGKLTIDAGSSGLAEFGSTSKATGGNSMAVGSGAVASGNISFAQGFSSTAGGVISAVFGESNSTGIGAAQSFATGFHAYSGAAQAVSMGNYTTASGVSSVALGNVGLASGDDSAAFNDHTTASGSQSLATGNFTTAEGTDSFSANTTTWAKGTSSTALNSSTYASGQGALAAGANTLAAGNFSFAAGSRTSTFGLYSFTTGNNSIATGESSAAFGTSSLASGKSALAAGSSTVATGEASAAFGNATMATGKYSFATGALTTAEGLQSAVFGYLNRASGDSSLAQGSYNTASGARAVALGQGSVASGDQSLAGGYQNTASGFSSVAMGTQTTASNNNAIALGFKTSAGADTSVAMGGNTSVTGIYSVSINMTSADATTVSQNRTFAITGGSVGIATVSPTRTLEVNGIVKATRFEGDGSGLSGISGATSASYATLAGTATIAGYAINASTATNAAYATLSKTATSAVYATLSGTATTAGYAINASTATNAAYATLSKTATSAVFATLSGTATTAGFAINAGNATIAAYATLSKTATSAVYATLSGTASSFAGAINYVLKAGDTMTGQLTLDSASGSSLNIVDTAGYSSYFNNTYDSVSGGWTSGRDAIFMVDSTASTTLELFGFKQQSSAGYTFGYRYKNSLFDTTLGFAESTLGGHNYQYAGIFKDTYSSTYLGYNNDGTRYGLLVQAPKSRIEGTLEVTSSIGIAKTDPTEALDIGDLSSGDKYIKLSSSGGSIYNNGIKLRVYTDDYGFTIMNEDDRTPQGLNIKYHNGDSNGTSAMYIDRSNGRIGINNTMTPTQELEVNGNVQATRFIGDGSQLTGLPTFGAFGAYVAKTGDTMSGTLQFDPTQSIYMPSSPQYGDGNDGRIGTNMFAAGLNLVGVNSDNSYRKINFWGALLQNDNPNGANSLTGFTQLVGNSLTTTDWLVRLYNVNTSMALLHGDGYGLNINTSNSEEAKYSIAISNGYSDTFRVTNNGKVGIKTGSPRTDLELRPGSIGLGDWTEGGLASRYVGIGDGNTWVGGMEIENTELVAGQTYSQKLHFLTHHNTGGDFGRRLTIDEDGKVGINNQTPSYRLDVNSPAENSMRVQRQGNDLMLLGIPSYSHVFKQFNEYDGTEVRDNYNNVILHVGALNEGSKVGIGTASPNNKLSVNGTIETYGIGGIMFPDGSIQISAAGAGASGFVKTAGDTMTGILTNEAGISVGTNNALEGAYSVAIGDSNFTNTYGTRSLAVGYLNTAQGANSVAFGDSNTAGGHYSSNDLTVGQLNSISGTGGNAAAIGYGNTLSYASNSFVAGQGNQASYADNVIALGMNNSVAARSIAIGSSETITTSDNIAIGWLNTSYGGHNIIMGTHAVGLNNNNFIFADSQAADFAAGGSDQFLIRAQGGVGIGTNSPWSGYYLDVYHLTDYAYSRSLFDYNNIGSSGFGWNRAALFTAGNPTIGIPTYEAEFASTYNAPNSNTYRFGGRFKDGTNSLTLLASGNFLDTGSSSGSWGIYLSGGDTYLGGNVGIGTTNNGARLQIASPADSNFGLVLSKLTINNASYNYGFVGISVEGASVGSYSGYSAGLFNDGSGYVAELGHYTNSPSSNQYSGSFYNGTTTTTLGWNNNSNYYALYTSGGKTSLNGGNVGIYTTTPNATLDVKGIISIEGTGNGIVFPDNSYLTSANVGGLNSKKVITNGTTSYTPTSGTKSVMIELWGGGGAGGGSAATAGSAGGGGGSGGYARYFWSSVGAGPYTVAVGAGGTGVSGATGNAGGNTTFNTGSLTVIASGGAGGIGGTGGAFIKFTIGGVGGGSLNGDINAFGAPGGNAMTSLLATTEVSGVGGSTSLGGGGVAVSCTTATTVVGVAGKANTGGGGGGSVSGTGTAQTGGAGGTGLMYIWEYK
jgi:trimeric autotransporter adhesin